MNKWLRFQTKSFGLTYRHKRGLNNGQAQPPFFRISRKSATAVKRNRIKRIVRHFFQNNFNGSSKVVFHIQKNHLNSAPDWKCYIKGLHDDLETMANEVNKNKKDAFRPRNLVH